MKITLTYKKKSEIIPIPNYKSSKKNKPAGYLSHDSLPYPLSNLLPRQKYIYYFYSQEPSLQDSREAIQHLEDTFGKYSKPLRREVLGWSFIHKKKYLTRVSFTLFVSGLQSFKREREKRELGWARSKHGAKTSCSKYTYTQYSFNCLFLITTQVGREVTGGQRSFRD